MTTWNFDPAHSNADFAVRHMMITTVRGGFKEVSGALEFDPENPADAVVEATIKASSIWTGVADRDAHLRSADFLDAENYPDITFKSTGVEASSDTAAQVTGDLTIRGVTKPVTLDVTLLGRAANPWSGAETLGFSATAKINREDFGLTWNQTLETGGVLVGKEITLSLDVEAVAVSETASV
jgi:polyisoprenoid-binding protein YceI